MADQAITQEGIRLAIRRLELKLERQRAALAATQAELAMYTERDRKTK